MTYAPFPEMELEKLASEYAEMATRFPDGSKFRDFYEAKVFMLRNAVACHTALRERCLVAEMELGQARKSA